MAGPRIPAPISCAQVRRLFRELLGEKLDAERRGRVEGHLLVCEECSLALADAIDKEETRAGSVGAAREAPPVLEPGVPTHRDRRRSSK